MDQSEDQILKKFNKYQFLKKTSQFVFSVSIFSFFVWYTSSFSIHSQSFNNAYFSTCLFSMFTHTLERKYMFLMCNGILAFIAKTSLMTSSPPTSSAFDLEFNNQEAPNLSETKAPVSVPLGCSESQDNGPIMVEEQVKKQEECNEVVLEASEEQEDDTSYPEIEGGEDECYIAEEGTENGIEDTTMTTNEELASTEELNRKFEEFIRKMKEEIRIEAQRQRISV